MSSIREKQIILITGATAGIGLDSAIHLASASPNNHVIIGARSLSKGSAVLESLRAQNLPGTLSLVELDADSDASITASAQTISQDFGRLDVLINNAAICPEPASAAWTDRQDLRAVFETNVFGPAILTVALLPLLKLSPSPKIINVSSSLGSIALRSTHSAHPADNVKYPGYRMSKAALNMLTAYQYAQLQPAGFKIWTYCPGYVLTNIAGDREQRASRGVDSSKTSASGIVEIVQGKRDAEVGMFISRFGETRQW